MLIIKTTELWNEKYLTTINLLKFNIKEKGKQDLYAITQS